MSSHTRREFTKLALAGVPALGFFSNLNGARFLDPRSSFIIGFKPCFEKRGFERFFDSGQTFDFEEVDFLDLFGLNLVLLKVFFLFVNDVEIIWRSEHLILDVLDYTRKNFVLHVKVEIGGAEFQRGSKTGGPIFVFIGIPNEASDTLSNLDLIYLKSVKISNIGVGFVPSLLYRLIPDQVFETSFP